MTDRVTLRCAAPAKFNACLFVGSPREEDGRHELVTVFQPLALADLLEATVDPGLGRDVVDCPGIDGPNLAADALAAYRDRTGWDGPPVLLRIEKRIPVAGGMAGGSADAAAALRLAARLADDDDVDRLEAIAATLGADVPSQVRGRRMVGTGTGATLQRTPARADWEAVVLPIDAELRAGAVFAEADRLDPPRDAEELRALRAAVQQAERAGGVEVAGLVINDLQRAARSLCPEIDGAIDALREAGAEHAIVSGSGPTVLGIFAPGAAADAHRRLAATRAAIPTGPERDDAAVSRWP